MPGFFLRRGSEVTGPHDAAAVRALAERGELGADDEISRDARTWRRLRDVRGFAPRAPVDAPQPLAPSDDPITLAEVAAPVWAVLRRAGAAAAKAAGSAARTAANAAADAAAGAADSVAKASAAYSHARSLRGKYTWFSFTDVKLSRKLETPMGSNVTVVNLWLTAHYAVVGDGVMIRSVRLARPRETPEGWNMVAARTGEAFAFTDYRRIGSIESVMQVEVANGLHRQIMQHHRRAGGSRTRD